MKFTVIFSTLVVLALNGLSVSARPSYADYDLAVRGEGTDTFEGVWARSFDEELELATRDYDELITLAARDLMDAVEEILSARQNGRPGRIAPGTGGRGIRQADPPGVIAAQRKADVERQKTRFGGGGRVPPPGVKRG